jgi:hypothetical protein
MDFLSVKTKFHIGYGMPTFSSCQGDNCGADKAILPSSFHLTQIFDSLEKIMPQDWLFKEHSK